MIKALVFDMDDTLYDQRTPFAQALQAVTNEPITPADTLDELFDTFQLTTSQITDDHQLPTLGKLLNPILTGHGLPIISSSNWDHFWELYQTKLQNISLFGEIEGYLSSLKDVYELGIITNGSAEQQSKKSASVGSSSLV
ncbi:HAD family hydrolase [Secundilactobacillus kimchicus]|uniref:HAD family hydrolase n=1 Tax=Secundilactobacillus kimchicus TaxID=528209 RepID=UPI0006D15664|nr:HAD hydrolase-like protein [Secundilactobacillus kimchicus]